MATVFYDLTGSYGTNLFGYDFYKECIRRGSERVQDLGPVLGSYHPVIAYNVRRLREISGLDEVSFHMSGTEAVMQAVRLAQYHTRRRRIVRFSGAYHGWWGDVQPGAGNPVPARDTLTLKEMGAGDAAGAACARRDIACVLVKSAAGVASEFRRSGRLVVGGQWTRRPLRPGRVHEMAARVARGVHRAAHRSHFR